MELTMEALMAAIRDGIDWCDDDFQIVNQGPRRFAVRLANRVAVVSISFVFQIQLTTLEIEDDPATTIRVKVVDGTIGGNTPEIDGTPINDLDFPKIPLDKDIAKDTGYNFFFRFIVFPNATNLGTDDDPIWVVQGGFVTGDPDDPTPIEIVFNQVGDDPTDGSDAFVDAETGEATPGIEYRRIATFFGDNLPTQPIETSLDFSICPNGINDDGNSLAKLSLFRA